MLRTLCLRLATLVALTALAAPAHAQATPQTFSTDVVGPTSFVQLADGRILVTEGRTANRVSVLNALNGSRTTVATGLDSPEDIIQIRDGRILVAEASRVALLDANTGAVSDFSTDVLDPQGLLELGDGRILVSEIGRDPNTGQRVNRVSVLDRTTGARSTLATGLSYPSRMVQLSNETILVADEEQVTAVDLTTGALSTFATGFTEIYGMAQLADGRIVVADYSDLRIVAIDPDTRAQSVLASGLSSSYDLHPLVDGRILVSEYSDDRVLRLVNSTPQPHYVYVSTPRSYAEAEADAVARGGHLASITTAAENEIVRRRANGAGTSLWIGLDDRTTEGSFAWTDGTPFTYDNWRTGEPNGGTSENCAEMNNDGTWNDNSCAALRAYVVEIPAGTPTRYELVTDAKSFNDAQADAVARRGWLASVASADDQTAVQTAASGTDVWIGFTDQDGYSTEGGFAWTDGTPQAYTNWNAGEPNNVNNEDCTVMGSGGGWNDDSCAGTRAYLVEIPTDLPPPTLFVDTAADDQTYDPNESLAECSDGISDGDCTLREAIEVANANDEYNLIAFNITSGLDANGVATITVSTALPAVASADVTIDGYTQPGASPNTLAVGSNAAIRVELVKANLDLTLIGLRSLGDRQTIRGLSIGGFDQAIAVIQAGGNGLVVEGNHLGVNAAGTTARQNRSAVVLQSSTVSARIGTDGDGVGDAGERNVLSGNQSAGVYCASGATCTIAGNYVGTNAAGTAALPNGDYGVYMGDVTARIGTTSAGVVTATTPNVISGNSQYGVSLYSYTTPSVVAGNLIGWAADGTTPLGNGRAVYVSGTVPARIGSDGDGQNDAAEGNRIANSFLFNGVLVSSGTASVLGNTMASNASLGIDLEGDGFGVTANDVGDADDGPNGLQNFPVITSASPTSVAFTLNSKPNRTYRAELFASAAADPSGYGEGQRYLGYVNVVADGAGNASGTFTPASALTAGEFVTATATPVTVDGSGNVTGFPDATDRTSEFSLAVAVATPGPLTLTVDTDADGQTYTAGTGAGSSFEACTDETPGNCTLREAIQVANAVDEYNLIAFDIQSGLDANGVATLLSFGNLPGLTSADVTIDGYTQPGATRATASTPAVIKIALVGTTTEGSRENFNGLGLYGANQTVRGLSIGRFEFGINLSNTSSGVTIEGNHLGVDPSGSVARGNTMGLNVSGALNTRIGTDGDGEDDAAERNVISGNAVYGAYVTSGSTATVIAGNYIGTNAAGTGALANANGVLVANALNSRIGTNGDGTADAAERNVISGNTQWGIFMDAPTTTGAVVAGNYIGTDVTGAASLANLVGIYVDSVPGVRIGSDGDGQNDAVEANLIARNGAEGISVQNTTTASILGNRFVGNGGIGIRLVGGEEDEETGVTANDEGDEDAGPNGLQNYPVITAASPTEVAFTLNTKPDQTYRVEFFASAAADDSGYGEGERYLGFVNVVADASGDASGTFTPASALAEGEFVTATATPVTVDGNGNVTGFPDETDRTSEFSLAVVASTSVPQVTVDTDADDQTYTAGTGVGSSFEACTDETPGNCTLREAIQVAIANEGYDLIAFDVQASDLDADGIATISPVTDLPSLTRAGITLDGYTQPGASGNTLAVGSDAAIRIVIDGVLNTGTADGNQQVGIVMEAAGQTVQGLAIGRFKNGIIVSRTVTGARIQGNHIGVDAEGAVAFGNENNGIVAGTGTLIGTNGDGTNDAAERNVISANGFYGIESIWNDVVVAGNYIGTSASGTQDLGNLRNGILTYGSSVRIGTNADGTADEAERNVISGNDQYGIRITAGSGGIIAGNYIGLDASGTQPLGNGIWGITANTYSSVSVRIGSNGDGQRDDVEANRIRSNGTGGIQLSSPGIAGFISGNVIADNGKLGIDLGNTGVQANDEGDEDDGANGLQNYPVLTAASPTEVAFTLNSTPDRTYRVEFFASAAADDSGYGEGERYLGFVNVTADGSGDASGTFTPAAALTAGEFVTATATPVTVDGSGNVTGFPDATDRTSEFSLAVEVTGGSVTAGSGQGYYLLAAPGDAETVQSYFAPVHTQCFPGADYTGSACTGTNGRTPNVYFYSEDAGGAATVGYAAPTTDPTAFKPGVGVAAYLFTDDDVSTPGTQGSFPKAFPLVGDEPTLPFIWGEGGNAPLTYHNTGDAADGLNLLGNPVRSEVNWDLLWGDSETSNVDPTAYLYDPANGWTSRNAQTHSTDNLNDGGNSFANGVIPAGAGFYVRTTDQAPRLRASGEVPTRLAASKPSPHVVVQVEALAEGGPLEGRTIRGGAAVVFHADAVRGDDALDAASLAPLGSPAVWVAAVETAGGPLRAQAVLPETEAAEVDLAVGLAGVATVAEVRWRAALPDGWRAVLVDRQTGAEVEMVEGGAYTVDLAGSEIVDGAPTPGRLAVRVVPAGATAREAGVTTPEVSLARPNPTASRSVVRIAVPTAERVTVSVYDALGRQVAVAFEGTVASAAEIPIEAGRLAPGVYVVRVAGASFAESRSLTVVR